MKKFELRKIKAGSIRARALLPGINLRRIAMKPLRQEAGIGAFQATTDIVKAQPIGDIKTRERYTKSEGRKVDTIPTYDAYRGIVNIYELLERPTPKAEKEIRRRREVIKAPPTEEVEKKEEVPVVQRKTTTKVGTPRRPSRRGVPAAPELPSPGNQAEVLTWLRRNFPGKVVPLLGSEEEYKKKYKPISPGNALELARKTGGAMVFYRKRGDDIQFAVLG